MKKLALAFLATLLCAQPAAAQWQTPNHSVPVGTGAGTGFRYVLPGAAGTVLQSGGASADPTYAATANSVSNSDGTLTISPTTGSVIASLNLGHANTWTGIQTFTGAYTGFSLQAAPATPAAGFVRTWTDSTTKTLRAINDAGTLSTTVIADTGSANNFLTAISAGGVISKARPACADLSDAGTGCTSTAPTPAALTKTDDTNVTLTLGGTPATALLQATSITAGWTGTLGVTRGGSGAGSFTSNAFLTGGGTSAFNAVAITGLVLGNGASAPSAYTGTSCTNQFPRSLSAAGVATCASVAIGSDVSGLGTGIAAALAAGISVQGAPITTTYNAAQRAGGFDIWQRLTNGATTIAQAASTTAYTNDGWYLITNANQAATVTQATGIAVGTGTSTVNGTVYAAKVQRNNGQTGTGVIRYSMPLDTDELVPLQNSNVALSFTIKEGANQSFSHTVNALVYCGTGVPGKRGASAYTGETTVISLAVTTTTTASRQQATSASVVPSTCTQMEIQFNITPSGTAGADDSFTVDDLQLEPVASSSAVATPYIKRTFRNQLADCQRFLMVYNFTAVTNSAFGSALSTSTAFVVWHLHVQMRTKPTGITISAAADFNVTDGGGTAKAVSTTPTLLGSSVDTASALWTVTGTPLTLGQGAALQSASAASQIIFTGTEL